MWKAYSTCPVQYTKNYSQYSGWREELSHQACNIWQIKSLSMLLASAFEQFRERLIVFQMALLMQIKKKKMIPNSFGVTCVMLYACTLQAVYKWRDMHYLQTTVLSGSFQDGTPHFIRITWPDKSKIFSKILQKDFLVDLVKTNEKGSLQDSTSFNNSVLSNQSQVWPKS